MNRVGGKWYASQGMNLFQKHFLGEATIDKTTLCVKAGERAPICNGARDTNLMVHTIEQNLVLKI